LVVLDVMLVLSGLVDLTLLSIRRVGVVGVLHLTVLPTIHHRWRGLLSILALLVTIRRLIPDRR
jgi:hypothetical protein